jgi:hypothetical protein
MKFYIESPYIVRQKYFVVRKASIIMRDILAREFAFDGSVYDNMGDMDALRS